MYAVKHVFQIFPEFILKYREMLHLYSFNLYLLFSICKNFQNISSRPALIYARKCLVYFDCVLLRLMLCFEHEMGVTITAVISIYIWQ